MQFGDLFFLGFGDATLAFDDSSWDVFEDAAAATADGMIPFADPFAAYYNPCDPALQLSKLLGEISRDAALAAAGLRGLGKLGGTRFGHQLNHNPYLRIGPGRWGKEMVPRISIGRGGPSWWTHWRL